ncbi:methylmalonyl Co-A mutase-associated GTPase MeaB [Flavobacteriaceae bacterium F89]|uniref:Methylmalonyl Co-A mutase-associated GTPase MeaB n=1 Tax=Cerina litoralis TaxID=2874477 RepID=A0AAE3EUX6_9FLAO|nr:methylmalonyl Co-A mutase-associated GTPase MeaB [Cerina litoralis]MCG2460975.1 methylmalonyl Co-A mutase-associated GTPase MeaB [Cerina litoralis]
MNTPKKRSKASKENFGEGKPTPSNLNVDAISKIKSSRSVPRSVDYKDLTQELLRGNKMALARAISLVESARSDHHQIANKIIEESLPYGAKSIRIGITGVPGVGKSTFIDGIGSLLTELGHKVAVLAVDPSSSLSKGSILGDKTRMQNLAKDPNAYIRPTPTGNSLGGVASKTRESIVLCEAAGFNIIWIETVGVGQSEIAVHQMVDFFLLLQLPGAGDELQGIKRGIVEMADAIAINKADAERLPMAKRAKMEYSRALHLYPPKENGWVPKVLLCSAQENTGIMEVWEMIVKYIGETTENGHFLSKRKEQNRYWFLQAFEEGLNRKMQENSVVKEQKEKLLQEVMESRMSPLKAAEKLLKLI